MSQITDLTKTKWQFNMNVTLQELGGFSINFSTIISNKIFYYDTLAVTAYPSALAYINSLTWEPGDPSAIIYDPNLGWKDSQYRTIWIDDGTDVTNSELINFLYNNASLMSSESTLN